MYEYPAVKMVVIFRLIVIVLFILIIEDAFSQKRFLYEVELGLNASSKPYKTKSRVGTGKNTPLVSPLAGVSITTNYWKRFSLAVGTQFYQSGQKYAYHSKGVSQGVSYTHSDIEEMRFTQVSFPIQFKCNFKVVKLKMNVFLGYTVSNFLKGSYYYKSESTFSQNVGRDYREERSFSPFSSDLEIPANRKTSLLSIGVGAKVMERIAIQIGFSTGLQKLYFKEYPTPGIPPDIDINNHYFNRADLAFSVKYLINK